MALGLTNDDDVELEAALQELVLDLLRDSVEADVGVRADLFSGGGHGGNESGSGTAGAGAAFLRDVLSVAKDMVVVAGQGGCAAFCLSRLCPACATLFPRITCHDKWPASSVVRACGPMASRAFWEAGTPDWRGEHDDAVRDLVVPVRDPA